MMPGPRMTFDPEFASIPQWAEMYRAEGLNVIPAYAPGDLGAGASWKRPCVPTWRQYVAEPILLETHQQWWGPAGPHAKRPQMGVITGPGSGNLVVVDLDEHKMPAARQWWSSLLAKHNASEEPLTWQQRTGGGGRQLCFRAPADWHAPTNKTSIGVDIRGRGGFAMLPPSKHESGVEYQWAPGFAPWQADLLDTPEWLLEAIERLVVAHGGTQGQSGVERTETPPHETDAWGNQTDGREEKMRDVVWAAMLDMHRAYHGVMPLPQDVDGEAQQAYAAYERIVGARLQGQDKTALLEREGRGLTEFRRKWLHALRQWDTKVAEAARQAPPKPEAEPSFDERVSAARPEGIFEFLDVRAIKTLPDPKWLVHGLVTEQALGFIFGPPGSGKSFVALSMALSLSVGMPDWWGREIERTGAVIYVSSEGQADLKFRIAAWEQHNKVLADDAPFYLIRQTINFMNPDDVAKLVATVEAVKVIAATEIVAVYVDTVSRVLPGADENLQKDMTLFVAACDAVRQRFGATVIGVHHTSRNGNLRGSTVFDGAGDFLAQIEREEGAKTGTLMARKIKAAEDGWSESFGLPVIELPFGKTSLVAVKEAAPPVALAAGTWPDKPTCRLILGAIQGAWNTGVAWSPKVQTKGEGRYAPRLINGQFGVEVGTAEAIVLKWLEAGVLTYDMADKKTKRMGLRVSGGID